MHAILSGFALSTIFFATVADHKKSHAAPQDTL
jgi:hypothetical protein